MAWVAPPNTQIVQATGTITTTSTTYVLATSMSVTLPLGTYAVWFGARVSGSVAGTRVFTAIFAGGVQVAASERESGGIANGPNSPAGMAIVTVNGTQAIELRWRVNSGTGTMTLRQLLLVKLT